jgi:hypothetical protein
MTSAGGAKVSVSRGLQQRAGQDSANWRMGCQKHERRENSGVRQQPEAEIWLPA